MSGHTVPTKHAVTGGAQQVRDLSEGCSNRGSAGAFAKLLSYSNVQHSREHIRRKCSVLYCYKWNKFFYIIVTAAEVGTISSPRSRLPAES